MKNTIAACVGALIFGAGMCGAQTASAPATATAPATRAADESTVPGMFKVADAATRAGGAREARRFYHATTADQRAYARRAAEWDAAQAKLEDAVLAAHGREGADKVIKAMGARTLKEILDADVILDGNKATLLYKDATGEVELIQVDGAWRIDCGAMLRDLTKGEIKEMSDVSWDMTNAMQDVREEIEAGKLKNVEQIVERVTKLIAEAQLRK